MNMFLLNNNKSILFPLIYINLYILYLKKEKSKHDLNLIKILKFNLQNIKK